MDKDLIYRYRYTRILFSPKKEWNFAILNLEGAMCNQTEKDKHYVISVICGILKKKSNEHNKKETYLEI